LTSLPAFNNVNMKVQQSVQSLVGLLSLIQGTEAWGTVGHHAIAYIAQNFVASATQQYCQNILGDTSTDYLANVAVWADTYRYTSAGHYTAPFHFIDANDDPLSNNCGVDYNRDCGAGGCVVSAINDFVSRVNI
jgi:S1/P1 Nuclease